MSILHSLKKAFGFSVSDLDDDDDEVVGIDATVKPLITPASIANGTAHQPLDTADESSRKPDHEADGPAEAPGGTATATPQQIFKTVVEVFNESMPPFVKAGLDPEAQSAYLFDRLDEGMQAYLKQLESDANNRYEARWNAERSRLTTQISTLEEKLERTQGNTADSRKLQLSAERQKRALSERVHDLEAQLARLEAENEQYDLENKSLVNKLRLVQVQGVDPDAAAEKEAEKEAEAAAAAQAAAEKEAEMAAAAEAAAARIVQLEEEVAELRDHLRLAADELVSSQQELEESHKSLEALDDIQQQIDTLEQMQAKKDARIKELTDDLRHRDDSIRELEKLNDSLRRTIENNLYAQAQSENILKQEIESLRSGQQKPAKVSTLAPVEKKKADRPHKISAIDESLEDTDWLISIPPDEKSASLRTSVDEDDSFGYHEPPRHKAPDDPAQMSLW